MKHQTLCLVASLLVSALFLRACALGVSPIPTVGSMEPSLTPLLVQALASLTTTPSESPQLTQIPTHTTKPSATDTRVNPLTSQITPSPALTSSSQINVIRVPFETRKWTEFNLMRNVKEPYRGVFYDIQIGSDGTIWTVIEDGISRYDGKAWTIYTDESVNKGNNIAVDSRGGVWLPAGYGITYFDGHTSKFFPRSDLKGRSIVVDQKGVVWAGSTGGRLFRFDGNMWKIYESEEKNTENDILDLKVHPDNSIWCAMGNELWHIDQNTWEKFKVQQFWPGIQGKIHALTISKDGTVWFMIGANKFVRLKNGKWEKFDVSPTIDIERVTTSCAANDGTVWLGTFGDIYDESLYNFDGKEVKIYTGAPFFLFRMSEDSSGNLWLASGSAVYRYQPHE